MNDRSTHYSVVENRKSADVRRDEWETVFGPRLVSLRRPKPTLEPRKEEEQREARRKQVLANALRVLRIVADADADQAKRRNGVGFSKGDTTLGHRLSTITIDTAMHDRAMSQKVVRLAVRYIRQAFEIQSSGLF